MTNNKGAWHIRAGTRTELDKQVREIMAALPNDANVSEFIKECIVKACRSDKEAAAQLDLEFFKCEIRGEIAKLKAQLVTDVLAKAPVEVIEQHHDELQEAKAKLQALESDW